VIVFDVSRLLAAAARLTPSGIERVELAYARHLIGRETPRCFVRVTRWGRLALLPQRSVGQFVDALSSLWRLGPSIRRRGNLLWATMRLRLPSASYRGGFATSAIEIAKKPVYLLVSHHHLEKRGLLARLKRHYRMSFVCLVHDLIPIEFPEYARPGQDRQHIRRIETVLALADAVIVPSAATAAALRRRSENGPRNVPIVVAPFGVEPPAAQTAEPAFAERPYFVCLGTIEARKNHLLLLILWRDLVARTGDRTPALVLVGRRGWEIESTIDMLDRCPALRGNVFERGTASDAQVTNLLQRARALLLPAHAEGFGFPVVEALACGTPVLCSDIPALRDLGGAVPEYLDPLDGGAWRKAILDYAAEPSPRRQAQLQRLTDWRPPLWADHFAAVEALIAEVAASPAHLG
jgi:glycosyltransferase involved in cell wall biosynthesis